MFAQTQYRCSPASKMLGDRARGFTSNKRVSYLFKLSVAGIHPPEPGGWLLTDEMKMCPVFMAQ
jgi:hypothetical protein